MPGDFATEVICSRRVMAIPMNAENTETLAWSDA